MQVLCRAASPQLLIGDYPAGEFRNVAHVEGLGLDIRADGGYVVGVGSQHPDGPIYQWEVSPDGVAFANVPSDLLAASYRRRESVSVAKTGPRYCTSDHAGGSGIAVGADRAAISAPLTGDA